MRYHHRVRVRQDEAGWVVERLVDDRVVSVHAEANALSWDDACRLAQELVAHDVTLYGYAELVLAPGSLGLARALAAPTVDTGSPLRPVDWPNVELALGAEEAYDEQRYFVLTNETDFWRVDTRPAVAPQVRQEHTSMDPSEPPGDGPDGAA